KDPKAVLGFLRELSGRTGHVFPDEVRKKISLSASALKKGMATQAETLLVDAYALVAEEAA
ncbi:MAG: hypothetical protein AABY11_01820, partial [archaeon]